MPSDVHGMYWLLVLVFILGGCGWAYAGWLEAQNWKLKQFIKNELQREL